MEEVKTIRKKKKRHKDITVIYVNSLQSGLLEKALADIYAKKVKCGTLNIKS